MSSRRIAEVARQACPRLAAFSHPLSPNPPSTVWVGSRLSQRAIAEKGTSYAYISRIEAGGRNPSIEALIAIADKLQTTALALLTGDPQARCPVRRRTHVDV